MKFKKLFFLTPDGSQLGHISATLTLFFGICRIENKKAVLMQAPRNINNEFYRLAVNGEKVVFLPIGWAHYLYLFLGKVYNLIRRTLLWCGFFGKVPRYNQQILFGKRIHDYCWKKGYEWKEIWENRAAVRLNPQQLSKATEVRRRLGIPDDGWIVCIHAREPGYYPDRKYHFYRDVDISNYLPLIDYVVKRGGWIIRIGDPSMSRLNIQHPHVIDYVHLPIYSGLMDLYWISHCKLFFGCESGPIDTSILFGVYTCMANCCVFTHTKVAHSFMDGIIFKHLYSKRQRRILSIRERLELPMDDLVKIGTSDQDGGKSDFIFIENTPEELLNFLIENLAYLEERAFDWNEELQDKFRKRSHEQLRSWALKNPRFQYQWYISYKVGRDYLEKCWDRSDYLMELSEDFQKSLGLPLHERKALPV